MKRTKAEMAQYILNQDTYTADSGSYRLAFDGLMSLSRKALSALELVVCMRLQEYGNNQLECHKILTRVEL